VFFGYNKSLAGFHHKEVESKIITFCKWPERMPKENIIKHHHTHLSAVLCCSNAEILKI
jgi:hypothetical protein